MYTKELDKFVMENETEILGMPHFHLGNYLLIDNTDITLIIFTFMALKETPSEISSEGLLLQSLLTTTIYSIYLSWHWRWNFDYCVYL